MQFKPFFSLLTLAMLFASLGSISAANDGASENEGETRKPNIVFILADDLGWSDTTLFNTTKLYETPHIERLAARGMTFTHAYAASPLCSPTRSAILTGLNPARTGLTAPNCHLPAVSLKAKPGVRAPADRKSVPVNSVTRLDPKYYTLSEALKDAGYVNGHFGKWHLGHEPYSPLENGFDVDLPHTPGPGPAGSYVAPWKYPDFDPDTPNEHIEDRMASEAVKFMEANKDKPFFLNYWMFSVHAPFDAKPDLIKKYRSKIDKSDPQKCPTYAAMIESMDDAVGTLLDNLDRLGVADNTIIVFASDNGGNMYNWVDDTFPTSNAPLRGGKATMFEGGVRGPCSVIWPGKIAKDSRSDEVIQSCDFYPTLLEMLELKPQKGQSFDGISIVPALKGGTLERDAIFTYFPHSPNIPQWLPPAVSVHKDDWKLIRLFQNGEDGKHRWLLYNLKEDIGETNNLAEQHPDKVQELDLLIENFLVETNAVRPTANPSFDPSKYDLAKVGQAEPHGKRPKKPGKLAAPVAGWQGNRLAKLRLKDGSLLIKSTGNDPYMSFDLGQSFPAADMQLRIKMSSNSSGDGQVFWASPSSSPKFSDGRSVGFSVDHDGQPHEYQIAISPQDPLSGIRIDPSNGPGKVTLLAAEITDARGKSLYRWKFKKK